MVSKVKAKGACNGEIEYIHNILEANMTSKLLMNVYIQHHLKVASLYKKVQ